MLAVTGPPQPFGSRVQVGERLPIAPPLGMAFIAWSELRDAPGPTSIAPAAGFPLRNAGSTWRHSNWSADPGLRRGARHCDASARDPDGDLARRRRCPTPHELDEILVELALDEYALLPRGDDTEYAVTALTAPVFAPDGEVILVLTIVGFPESLPAEQLPTDTWRARAKPRPQFNARCRRRSPSPDCRFVPGCRGRRSGTAEGGRRWRRTYSCTVGARWMVLPGLGAAPAQREGHDVYTPTQLRPGRALAPAVSRRRPRPAHHRRRQRPLLRGPPRRRPRRPQLRRPGDHQRSPTG